MGWFGSSQETLPTPKISADGAPIAPDRSQRARCWEHRDAYFSCLERNDIIDSIKERDKAAKECSAEGKGFEANCASSWVEYFKKRRVVEYKRDETLKRLQAEGAQGTYVKPGQAGKP
ncbi:cytochrome oxidase c subunit VIb-domain-containing protein [Calycina marina]|uniref:Cytochrome oxidase c subunit VIb-domain-containing protein n=1 Tax=Calycina marina TaxID=1763456 RepID=A0A9P8CI52_9HELO|nr:cytochrome oxidase c subunit VIb-domain-containing protein [Calycina marina]